MTPIFPNATIKPWREDFVRRAADEAETHERCPARACARHRRCAGPFIEKLPFCVRWFARPRPEPVEAEQDWRAEMMRILERLHAETRAGEQPAAPPIAPPPPDHTRRDPPPWDE